MRGWEFVHVCIDDASRIAFTQIMPDEKKESAIAFLKAALAYYQSLGVTVARVMTDNGSCYKAFAFREPAAVKLKHIRTRPYTPKPTARPSASSRPPREWAYAKPVGRTSDLLAMDAAAALAFAASTCARSVPSAAKSDLD